jgi:Protein of unknown function (DUF1353)
MQNYRIFFTLAMLVLGLPDIAQAQFEGLLELTPPRCQRRGKCVLKHTLRFTDKAGTVWEAGAGLETDGASIPPLFQPFVGKPFEKAFIKAAIIHDYYCGRHVRPWRQTHRAFYEGLLDQGVPKAKASAMYYAVYLAGPKWANVIAGDACAPSHAVCRRGIDNTSLGTLTKRRYIRSAEYGHFLKIQAQMQQLMLAVERNVEMMSLENIEELADAHAANISGQIDVIK